MNHKQEQSYTAQKKTHWINWLIPSILVLSAIAVLIFYPSSDPVDVGTSSSTNEPVEDNSGYASDNQANDAFPIKEIANSLVSTFFNGSDEDRNEQVRALENTLAYLNNWRSKANSTEASTTPKTPLTPLTPLTTTASKTLKELQENNLNEAINTLVAAADQQVNPRNAAKIWINIGNIQNLTSAQQALLAYQKASELDPDNSNAWNRRGHLHRQLNQFEAAEKAFKRVQKLTSQSTANQAMSLANFGLLNQSKGDYEAAEKAFHESLNIYTEIDNPAGMASTSENLASLYKHKGALDKAETYYLKALNIYQKQQQFQQIASTHAALGSLYQGQKLPEKARHHYQQALEISIENNFQGDIASLYSNLGILAQQANQLEKSKELFEKSLQINQQIKRSTGTADQYGNLAILNRNKKNYAAAEDFHRKAIQIHVQNKHKNGIISQYINLGFLYKAWNKTDKACEAWRKSLGLLQSDQSKRAERVTHLIEANCR